MGRVRSQAGLGRSLVVAAAVGALALASLTVESKAASAASPPGTVDTGDPQPPADPSVPDGLDEPAPVPDDSIVEMPPPASPAIVPNANTARIAWVGTPAERPADAALITLQAALNTAPEGGAVSFDPNDYAFTGSLTVPRAVTLASSAASILYARFTVSGGGLTLGDTVTIAAANTGAVVTVTSSGALLAGITIRNPTPVLRPTGIQLAAGISGVRIEGLDMDGGGEASSYGVNLTTGSATIMDAAVTGVATGVTATAASTAGGITITGGAITASTSGVSLGSAVSPSVSGLEVTGPASAGTGIDLAQSSGAVIDSAVVHGFARGIGTATTNANAGPTITNAVIDGSSREGIALGATGNPRVVGARVTGADTAQSTGILTLLSTGATITTPTIAGMMYGITTNVANTGAGPTITDPTITAFGGITLGSTQGARVTGAVLDAGGAVGGTEINLVNAGRVTVEDEKATGYLYAIGSQSSFDPASDRTDISITDVTVIGAPNASHGVYLLGARNATIEAVDADITGAALVIHQSVGVTAHDIVVHGHEGPTSNTGSSILRAYGSQHVDVDDSSIDAGSYGFFYSGTDGSTITDATVAGLVEYGLYGRSAANVDVSGVTFTGNSAVGLFVVTTPADGISHDIAVHGNTMRDNDDGLFVLQGTTAVSFAGNTISGQRTVVTAGPAHDLAITGNTIDQAGADGFAAITVAPLWQDGSLAGSYSSSGVRIVDNVFSGAGTWLQVGTADGASPDSSRRTLRDPVLVTGNTFPAASAAIRTYANAVDGDDTAPEVVADATRAEPLVAVADGPVAVDARDYDDPNDWGARCKATGFLDGDAYYAGGGAEVHELSVAPVLYPMNCIDLSLTESLVAAGAIGAGGTVTWTLTPHNDGPRAAPAGWSIRQLVPAGVELVSMSGAGYSVDGRTAIATSAEEIPPGDDGPALTVTVRVTSPPPGTSSMKNVAYIAPGADTDLDGDGYSDAIIEQFGPLVVPTIDTDTDVSETDNDAQGVWATTSTGGGGGGGGAGAGGGSGGLSDTGSDIAPALLLAAGLLAAGLWLRRGRRARQS
ncbi:right-handed parallel beta-helix repeat-containing protein [Leifsonia sp. NPDC080035]|uniref:Right-handed parallel beta-helix repeat-containing protein n=1 Tax=Leifsonia sp. NPDC080035 TaxID=3143936 RepID=A0AAU7GHY3_9MICO